MTKAQVNPVTGFGTDPVPPKAKQVKTKVDEQAARGEKFEVDLDNYLKFVDLCTSEESKD